MVISAAWRCLVMPGGAWRCLVVLVLLGGAWWYMTVQCVWFMLFGAAWRCLVALGGAWWCLVFTTLTSVTSAPSAASRGTVTS